MVLFGTKATLNAGSPVAHHGAADLECTTELRRNPAGLSGSRSSRPHHRPLSAREAVLFRNFVDNMASWVCGPGRYLFFLLAELFFS